MADRDFLDKLAKRLVDDGKLIEAGWVMFRKVCIHEQAPAAQLSEMRMAFFAGCQHLFGAINQIMEDGVEPTEADLDRMTSIDNELRAFIEEFKAVMAKRGGQSH